MPKSATVRATGQPDAHMAELVARVRLKRIVFESRGRQIRGVTNGARTVRTFVYPSWRERRRLTGEGLVEELLTYRSEVHAHILHHLPQPLRIEAELGGSKVQAIPDYALVVRGSDRPILGEAKRSWDDFDSERALVQQALTRKAAEHLGFDYGQTTLESLGPPHELAAVEEIQANRFQHVSPRQEQLAVRAVAGGATTLGEIARELHRNPANGRAVAHKLMVARLLEIDLQAPLGDASLVRAAPAQPNFVPTIRRPRP